MSELQDASSVLTVVVICTFFSLHLAIDPPCDGTRDCNLINHTVARCIFKVCRIPRIDGPCQQSADCIHEQFCLKDNCTSRSHDGPCQFNSHCFKYQYCHRDLGKCSDKESTSFPQAFFYFFLSVFFLIISIFVCLNVPSSDDPVTQGLLRIEQ